MCKQATISYVRPSFCIFVNEMSSQQNSKFLPGSLLIFHKTELKCNSTQLVTSQDKWQTSSDIVNGAAAYLLQICQYFLLICLFFNLYSSEIRCGPPPKIAHSNVTTSHNSDGTITYATYHCFSGYAILDFRDKLQPSFVMSCDEGQLWGKIKTPKCGKCAI